MLEITDADLTPKPGHMQARARIYAAGERRQREMAAPPPIEVKPDNIAPSRISTARLAHAIGQLPAKGGELDATPWVAEADLFPKPDCTKLVQSLPHVFCAVAPITDSAGVLLLKEVCEKYGSSLRELRGNSRVKGLVMARKEAAYRLRVEFPHFSFPVIARLMGYKDPTTVMYHVSDYASRNDLPSPAPILVGGRPCRNGLPARKREGGAK